LEEKGLIYFLAIAISSKFSPQNKNKIKFQTRFPNPKNKRGKKKVA
jgi:hypothetical protein